MELLGRRPLGPREASAAGLSSAGRGPEGPLCLPDRPKKPRHTEGREALPLQFPTHTAEPPSPKKASPDGEHTPSIPAGWPTCIYRAPTARRPFPRHSGYRMGGDGQSLARGELMTMTAGHGCQAE